LSKDLGATDTRIDSAPKPIVFLDRDGVLNVDHGYVFRPEDVEWSPDAAPAVRALNEQGFVVLVATNQSGIGRGLYSEENFHRLMAWMTSELATQGARLDGYYFCPHHPTEALPPYRRECDCRKPNPGMLLDGLRDHHGDPARSFFIGDKETDMEAARAAGVRGILYKGGSLLELVQTQLRATLT